MYALFHLALSPGVFLHSRPAVCVSTRVTHSRWALSLSLSLSFCVYVDARTPLLCANEGNGGGVRAGLSPSPGFSSTGFCMTYDLPYCHGTQAAHVRAYRRKNACVPTRQRRQPRDRREKERLSHQVARAERGPDLSRDHVSLRCLVSRGMGREEGGVWRFLVVDCK